MYQICIIILYNILHNPPSKCSPLVRYKILFLNKILFKYKFIKLVFDNLPNLPASGSIIIRAIAPTTLHFSVEYIQSNWWDTYLYLILVHYSNQNLFIWFVIYMTCPKNFEMNNGYIGLYKIPKLYGSVSSTKSNSIKQHCNKTTL